MITRISSIYPQNFPNLLDQGNRNLNRDSLSKKKEEKSKKEKTFKDFLTEAMQENKKGWSV